MSDAPNSSGTSERPEAPRAAPLPPGVGWYQGPFPPAGYTTREHLFRTLLRRFLTAVIVVTVLFGAMFGFFIMIAAIGAAIGSTGDAGSPDDLEKEFAAGDRNGNDEVLIIDVHGVILGEDPGGGGLFNFVSDVTYGYSVRETLRKAALDDDIKAVMLDMNTPGGTIFGSQAVADAIKQYRADTGNPVLAFVSGISASGGMWSMAPADHIMADHGTLVGSIGVIMGPFTYYNGVIATDGGILGGGVTTANGITQEYITAGRSKDVGNPFRPLTDAERQVLQENVNSSYSRFVTHIATERGISEATIRDTLGAMVFGNEKAEEYGLIDSTGSLQDAYRQVAQMAGLDLADVKFVREDSSLGGLSGLFAEGATPVPSAKGICFPPNTVLAFYGDLGALCPK